ncbi:interleukin 12Ba precursor isoform X1 [Gadus morhua]|uniref:interleukin 12Ba precursor isoform X1 n=1 Tax=Gadus morhua TaxID=8049 RepID=UPI0011B6700A|nr:interleukin-12 subunit beta-like isoform X1 [Gadus morhua]
MSSKAVRLLVIFSVYLMVNGNNPKSQRTLLPNVLVLEVTGQQAQFTLPCLDSTAEMKGILVENIVWMVNGADTRIRGNTFIVYLEESFGGGNYTCYSEERALLNHTLVLLQQVGSKRADLNCTAQNYDGGFHCYWKYPKQSLWTVALVKAERLGPSVEDTRCITNASGKSWTSFSSEDTIIHCDLDRAVAPNPGPLYYSPTALDLDTGGNGTTCRETCPQPEETQLLRVSVCVYSENFILEEYSNVGFYVREIVKPDKVKIEKVNATMAEWSYPESWSSPHSYFPLVSQVVVRKNCKKCGNCTGRNNGQMVTNHAPGVFQFEIKKTKILCVRIRDPLYASQWSDWSRHRVGKKLKKNRYPVDSVRDF